MELADIRMAFTQILENWYAHARAFGYVHGYIALLKMGSYSSTTMCHYWDNRLIY